MPSFDPNAKLPTGTVKQPGLFSNIEVDVPAPINPERQRVGQSDTEIRQKFAQNTNFLNPLSIAQGVAGMVKDKAQQVQNTSATLANAQGFMDDTSAINNRLTQSIISGAKSAADSANASLAAQKAQPAAAPRKSVEDTIRTTTAPQTPLTPQQKERQERQNLLASVDRQNKEYDEQQKRVKEMQDRHDAARAADISKGQFLGDTDTLLKATRQLNQRGVYVSQAGKDFAQARNDLGIRAVDQGSLGPSRLQDMNATGTPKLMTGQEVAKAGPRFDQFMQRDREIAQGVRDRTRGYFQQHNPSMMPKTLRQPTTPSPLFREAVEKHRQRLQNSLNENIYRTVGKNIWDFAKGLWGFARAAKNPVRKATDPIVSGIGSIVKASPRNIVKAQKLTGGLTTAGLVAGMGGGLYAMSGRGVETKPPETGEIRNFGSGFGGPSAADRKKMSPSQALSWDINNARRERKAIVNTAIAQAGGDRQKAMSGLNKDINFQRLSISAARGGGENTIGGGYQHTEGQSPAKGFGVGRGFAGTPAITGGSYVNPNSPEGRVKAEEKLRSQVRSKIAERDNSDPEMKRLKKDLEDAQRANRIRSTPEYADELKKLQSQGGIVGNSANAINSGQHSTVSASAAAHNSALTTSGRTNTAMQPDRTWDEVAKQGLDSRFAGAQLSRRDGKVFANRNGNEEELPTATERTRQYASNAPTREQMR